MMLENLQNKKIAIVGLGTNNRHLAEFLTAHKIAFEVVDGWKDKDELIGKLGNFDIIFRSPGLPYLSSAIQQAKAKGVEISSQTKLFFELCPAPIIGVTGTKGKGTTSSLITKILQDAGKTVWLGGNIGTDPFEFFEKIKPNDFVVLELSSFQLQDLDRSPHIAAVLNVTSDHLDHHTSIGEYVEAKSSILAFQNENDFAVLFPGLPESFKNLGKAKKILFDPHSVEDFQTKLLGKFNYENIAAAEAVARILKIDGHAVRQAVAAFEGLAHHMQKIRVFEEVTYIDDSISTNIDPTIGAIASIDTPLILIVGGFDKGLEFHELGSKIISAKNLKAVVVIGAVTDKILKSMTGYEGKILTGAKNMKEIVAQARSMATPGDTVLISPGTSSFDMFKNVYDRAEQFVNAIKSL